MDNTINNACPLYGGGPHYTMHHFSSQRKSTTLNVTSLWTKPVEAVAFLDLKMTSTEDEKQIYNHNNNHKNNNFLSLSTTSTNNLKKKHTRFTI